MTFRDPSEERIVENFLEEEGIDEEKKTKILGIIKGMGKLFEGSYFLVVTMYYFSVCHVIFFPPCSAVIAPLDWAPAI